MGMTVNGNTVARHNDAEDDLDRLNNSLQVLAVLQYAAGVEVTAVRRGDVRYHTPKVEQR
jgi:hypothetical protein